ncbi:RNA exonuclease 4 [Varanus komodoensis]|uniref:RNA exonuclease 4 n=1 Tax=Varanus komodoensis TaxID=61221 RepID=A0A8D2J2W6_VARKO|nr:RNA exonuclease 4 [Varanus komodoensis]XP_044295949.1 RNA exonuclease 4 [Varanus komodoensis]XP_044295950.1 RNA exonuclease 4 [Varanus komodoensis]
MAKIKAKEAHDVSCQSTTKPESLKNQHKKKKKKKKLFWKKKNKQVEKKAQRESKPAGELPPKTPQEFSSNWKALQELLKKKEANLNCTVTALDTSSKKKHTTKAAGIVLRMPNGTKKSLTFQSAEMAKKNHVEGFVQQSVTKPEKPLHGKRLPQAWEDGKKCKGGLGRGSAEQKERNFKHKKRKTEEQVEPKPEDIWFDDVDPDDIEAALGPEAARLARKKMGIQDKQPQQPAEQTLVKEKAFEGLTKAVAMDCEMVGVGPTGEDSIVARVSIVNLFGKCIYDKYVKPTEEVTDYRTAVSGIRPENLRTGENFKVVQKEVADILRGRILAGHALHNDLKVLFLDHPKKKIRDTQKYKPFKQQVKSGRPSLKLLCEKLLNVKVQTLEHSSIQDAQAAMRLYTLVKKQWEASLKVKRKEKKD